MSVNKVMLIGNLGRDPEIRYTTSGQAVANFTLATTEKYTNKAGDKQEDTEWHRIVAWGRLAEICGEYLTKAGWFTLKGRSRPVPGKTKKETRNGRPRLLQEICKCLAHPGADLKRRQLPMRRSQLTSR